MSSQTSWGVRASSTQRLVTTKVLKVLDSAEINQLQLQGDLTGDGSNALSQLGSVNADTVTALQLYGDGSNITNIPGASPGSIPNNLLQNDSVTLGSTEIELGGVSTTLTGLTQVSATNFVGGGAGVVGVIAAGASVGDGSNNSFDCALIFTPMPGPSNDLLGDALLYFSPTTNTLSVPKIRVGSPLLNNPVSPSASLDIATTDAVKVPSGTTTQRPTPVNGMIRYNSDDNEFEGYRNGAWSILRTSGQAAFQFTQVSALSTITLSVAVPIAVPPLTVTITPESTSSVIRIESQVFGEFTNWVSIHNHVLLLGRSIGGGAVTLLKNPTGLYGGISACTLTYSKEDNSTTAEVGHLVYYDQPSTTSPTTYTLYIQSGSSAGVAPYFVLNRVVSYGVTAGFEYGISNISAEIK